MLHDSEVDLIIELNNGVQWFIISSYIVYYSSNLISYVI